MQCIKVEILVDSIIDIVTYLGFDAVGDNSNNGAEQCKKPETQHIC